MYVGGHPVELWEIDHSWNKRPDNPGSAGRWPHPREPRLSARMRTGGPRSRRRSTPRLVPSVVSREFWRISASTGSGSRATQAWAPRKRGGGASPQGMVGPIAKGRNAATGRDPHARGFPSRSPGRALREFAMRRRSRQPGARGHPSQADCRVVVLANMPDIPSGAGLWGACIDGAWRT